MKKRLLKVSGWILFINAFFPSENWKITVFISPIKKTDVKPQNHKVIYKSSEKSSHQWAAVNKKYPRLLLLHTSFWSSGFFSFYSAYSLRINPSLSTWQKTQPYPIVLFLVGVQPPQLYWHLLFPSGRVLLHAPWMKRSQILFKGVFP